MLHAITYSGPPEHRVQLEVIAIGLDAEPVTIYAARQSETDGYWLALIKDRKERLHTITTKALGDYLPLTDQLKEFGPKLCAWSPDDPIDSRLLFD